MIRLFFFRKITKMVEKFDMPTPVQPLTGLIVLFDIHSLPLCNPGRGSSQSDNTPDSVRNFVLKMYSIRNNTRIRC